MSQTGQQINTIHILLNISRSKGNQTMKCGQLIECNMTNTLLEILYTKCGREFIRIYKNLKLTISLDQQSGIL